MESLKQLMGNAYHDGVTVEEINSFLANEKFVNLKDGNYVAKDKLTRVETEKANIQKELDTLKESTKDYDTIKTENESFKAEKTDNELKTKLTSYGVNEKFFKYVKGDINEGSLKLTDKDDDNKKAIAEYLKTHGEFALNPDPAPNPNANVIGRIFKTGGEQQKDDKPATDNKSINDLIRAAAGRKIEAK